MLPLTLGGSCPSTFNLFGRLQRRNGNAVATHPAVLSAWNVRLANSQWTIAFLTFVFFNFNTHDLERLHCPYLAVCIGQAKVPGPPDLARTIIDIGNVTNACKRITDMGNDRAHCLLFGEHSANKAGRAWCRAKLREMGWTSVLTSLDPELKHPTGGVGGMVREGLRIFKMKPLIQKGHKLVCCGRLAILGVDFGGDVNCIFYVVYGFTGGRECKDTAKRTDAIVQCVLEEQLVQPQCPSALCGDLNCDPEHLPNLQI